MKGQPVLFNGARQVLQAYCDNGIANWAILAGKEIFTAFEDADITLGEAALAEALKLLEKGGSQGTLTLRVYPDNIGTITYSSVPLRGFNFRLYEENGSPWHQNQARIAELEAQNLRLIEALESAKEEDDEEEKPSSILSGIQSVVGQILQDPDMKQMIMAGVGTLLHKVTGMFNRPAQVAGVQNRPTEFPQDQINKVDQALDILEAIDAQLGDHLLKLAAIAQSNPGTYKMLLGMLEKM